MKFKKGEVSLNKGKKASPETLKKLSDSHKGQISWCKGKKLSEETRKKISDAGKGRIPSLATREKMSLAGKLSYNPGKFIKGFIMTDDTKRKISISGRGRVTTEEAKRKISLANTGKKRTEDFCKRHSILKSGKIVLKSRGLKRSMDIRIKMSLLRTKENEFTKFRSPENKRLRGSPEYKNWRLGVINRDEYKCQKCGSNNHLEAHHIKPFSKFISDRFNIDNGITYCTPCHAIIDTYRKRTIEVGKIGL